MHLEDFDLFVQFLKNNRPLRRKFTQWSHPLFNTVYLPPPLEVAVPTADFQREIFRYTEDKSVDLCVIAGFRESGKSTICTVSFPLWAVLSRQAHFVVIASQTRQQARTHLANVRRQLESNALLKNDFGPFTVENDEWGAYALQSTKYDARIIAVSTETSVRGLLYKHYRPDLIICDDIEDLASTKTQESRNRIYTWFTSEIIPLGSKRTRIFVLGNFLHEFSLVGRLMAQIESGERDGVARKYPLLDANKNCLWPGMYPTPEAVEAKKRKVGDEATWEREYQLRLIASSDRLVLSEWIQTYDELPSREEESYWFTWFAADLAIGKNEGNDYTAIVSAEVHADDQGVRIYIRPEPVRAHLSFPEAMDTMQALMDENGEPSMTKFFVEATGFQEAYAQYLIQRGYEQVVAVKVKDSKENRLRPVTKLIRDGIILFPKRGADQLVTELIGFGREHHDDLVDSFTMLIAGIMEYDCEERPLRNFVRYVEQHGWPYVNLNWNPYRADTSRGLIDDSQPRSSWSRSSEDSGYRNDPPSRSEPTSYGGGSSSGSSGSSGGSGGHRSGPDIAGMLGDAARRRFG